MKQKLATGSYSGPRLRYHGRSGSKSWRRSSEAASVCAQSVLWSTPRNACHHTPSWPNISSKAPWCIAGVHISPSHVSMSSLARRSHGRPSLQTHTGCGSGVRWPSPRVGMTKAPPPASMTLTSTASYPYPTMDTCSYASPQNLTPSQSPGICSSDCICVLATPGPGYILIPTSPAHLVFRTCSLHIPGRPSRFTGCIWGAAGWPRLGQQGGGSQRSLVLL